MLFQQGEFEQEYEGPRKLEKLSAFLDEAIEELRVRIAESKGIPMRPRNIYDIYGENLEYMREWVPLRPEGEDGYMRRDARAPETKTRPPNEKPEKAPAKSYRNKDEAMKDFFIEHQDEFLSDNDEVLDKLMDRAKEKFGKNRDDPDELLNQFFEKYRGDHEEEDEDDDDDIDDDEDLDGDGDGDDVTLEDFMDGEDEDYDDGDDDDEEEEDEDDEDDVDEGHEDEEDDEDIAEEATAKKVNRILIDEL